MTELMQSVACRLAASSCCCDQSAHTGSFSTRSRITLVSTRINELVLPAGQRHDLVGAHLYSRYAAQPSEAAHRPVPLAFAMAQYYIAAWCELEVHGRAGFNPKQVANFFGNRDLPLGGYSGCHWNKVIR